MTSDTRIMAAARWLHVFYTPCIHLETKLPYISFCEMLHFPTPQKLSVASWMGTLGRDTDLLAQQKVWGFFTQDSRAVVPRLQLGSSPNSSAVSSEAISQDLQLPHWLLLVVTGSVVLCSYVIFNLLNLWFIWSNNYFFLPDLNGIFI